VAAGVAAYLGLDATLVRILFVLLALAGGSGVFLYLAGWVLLPTAAEEPSSRPVALRTDSVPAVVGAGVLVLAAWIALGPLDWDGGILVPVLLIGVGVWLLNQRPGGTSTSPAGPAPTGPWAPPSPAGWPPPAGGDQADAPGWPTGGPGHQPVPGAPGGPSRSAQGVPGNRADPTLVRLPGSEPHGPDPTATGPGDPTLTGADATREMAGFVVPPAPPPPPAPWAVPHGPNEPARRARSAPAGPPITSFTLALLAVILGGLLALHAVGAIEVTAVVLSATTLLVLGAGLVVSAFLGRARGLIPLGLLAALALAVSPVVDEVTDHGIGDREVRVASASQLEPLYELGTGRLVVDLRNLDARDLDRPLKVSVGIGRAEVIVPDGVQVVVHGSAGAGDVELFDRSRDGMGVELRGVDGPAGSNVLELDAEVGIGSVAVTRG
jgi:phage shock protein PspC (stress-responsive transcriptional regulator)